MEEWPHYDILAPMRENLSLGFQTFSEIQTSLPNYTY